MKPNQIWSPDLYEFAPWAPHNISFKTINFKMAAVSINQLGSNFFPMQVSRTQHFQSATHSRGHNSRKICQACVNPYHLSRLADRVDRFSNETHQFCQTESCFWLNWPYSLRMNSLVIKISLSSAKRTQYICGDSDLRAQFWLNVLRAFRLERRQGKTPWKSPGNEGVHNTHFTWIGLGSFATPSPFSKKKKASTLFWWGKRRVSFVQDGKLVESFSLGKRQSI